MIKKSPKKYFILLLILEFFLIVNSINQYFLHRSSEDEVSYAAKEMFSRAGSLTEAGYYVDSTEEYSGIFTYGPYISLKMGSYRMTVQYSTDTDGNLYYLHSNSLVYPALSSASSAVLKSGGNSVTFAFELSEHTQDLELVTEYCGEGFLQVEGITIRETPLYYSKQIFNTVLFCLFAAFCYCFYISGTQARKTILVLSLITLAASYPLFTDYLLQGHDLEFHLLRIEGIKEGLQNGVFPVKIHPLWANGHGYAVGVFYGDAFLYFPAFLRIMGFSIQSAYKIYIAAFNILTVLISWLCFKKIFGSNLTGLFGSMLYTLSAYRLSNVYLRGSVGEYTALTFLPLVLCGFYLIFTQPPQSKGYMKNFLWPALGLTGIIQSHVISCELVGIFILAACLIMIGRVIIPKVFATLCLALGATVLLNAGFLFPFLDYFGGDFVMNAPEWFETPIQGAGAYVTQLFSLFQNGTGSSSSTSAGMAGEMPLGPGFPLLLGLGIFLFILAAEPKPKQKDSVWRFALLSGLFCVCSLYMATSLFPWNRLASLSGLFKTLIYNIQFPWRLLVIASLFLTVICCFAFRHIRNHFNSGIFYASLAVLFCTLAVSTGWFYYDCLNSNVPYRPYDTPELNTMLLGSEEYLPQGTDAVLLLPDSTPAGSPQLSMTAYDKQGTSVSMAVQNGDQEGTLELPLLYYPGYQAVDTQNGSKLSLEKGGNNLLKVTVPAGFEGNISVSFREPLLWRAGELLSLVSFLALLTYCIFRYAMPFFKNRTAEPDASKIEA